jgi:L-threonylcarbamoyladenylate synthase
MKIIKINPKKPDESIIDDVVETLKQGGVIVYPSDTCYGLGADITNIFAIEKIYRIKNRNNKQPLSIIVKNIEQLQKYALVKTNQKTILLNHLPGPFTFLLLNLNYKYFKLSKIGLRIPDYLITQLIANKFNKPYATTSANITNNQPCYSIGDFLKQINKSIYLPDLILDAGPLPVNPPSTIVDLTGEEPIILRQGGKKLII